MKSESEIKQKLAELIAYVEDKKFDPHFVDEVSNTRSMGMILCWVLDEEKKELCQKT